MGVFEDVKLSWKDKVYTIKADNIMRLLARLESEDISLYDLRSHRPPLAKISIAYAIALNHAGCPVIPEEVYAEMFSGTADVSAIVAGAVTGLMMLMTPPDNYQPYISKDSEKK